MQRRQFLKQLGLAASFPWLRFAAAAADAPPAPQANSHTVLSCNIRVDVPEDHQRGDGWADRQELCGDVIRAQKPDLIGLQECQKQHLESLKARLPEFDSFGLSDPKRGAHPVNTILFARVRYALVSSGGFWLSETPEVAGSKSWDSARPRLVNWVQLKVRASGQEFRFWNTHLDHIGQTAREKQAGMIVKAAAALPSGFPQLLTGDFNAHANNPAIKLVAASGWTDTYSAIHGPEDPGFTAHGFLGPRHADQLPKGKHGGRIDWIWCRGPVRPLAAAVIRSGRNGHYPSDHYFMRAELALNA